MVDQPHFSPAKPARPAPAATPLLEPTPSLQQAAADIHECRRCELWQPATQPVFGEGPPDARIMFVGEQPGDQEDLAGRPFVGPAGQLFDRAMAEAGFDRTQVYVTNAVKHFKFVPRGKRRIHEKPGTTEIVACKFWLDLERAEIEPAVTVMLGATAARAVLGRTVTISRERGPPVAARRQPHRLRHRAPELPAAPAGRGRQGARVPGVRSGPTLDQGSGGVAGRLAAPAPAGSAQMPAEAVEAAPVEAAVSEPAVDAVRNPRRNP